MFFAFAAKESSVFDDNSPTKSYLGDEASARSYLEVLQIWGGLHSQKLTWTLTGWPPGRLFSSTNQWFSGSMLVFQGVRGFGTCGSLAKTPRTNHVPERLSALFESPQRMILSEIRSGTVSDTVCSPYISGL